MVLQPFVAARDADADQWIRSPPPPITRHPRQWQGRNEPRRLEQITRSTTTGQGTPTVPRTPPESEDLQAETTACGLRTARRWERSMRPAYAGRTRQSDRALEAGHAPAGQDRARERTPVHARMRRRTHARTESLRLARLNATACFAGRTG